MTKSISWRAWAAFALGCSAFGYAFLQRVAPSVMTEELMRAFSVGAGALGALSAWYFYAYAAIQMPVGLLMDRFGPRKLLAGALAASLIGSLVFATADALGIASAGRFLIGAASAFGYVGTMAIAAAWFPSNRFSFLVGILQSIGMLGAIAGQAPLSVMVEAIGWRETLLVLGGIGALLAVLIYFIVQEVPRTERPQPDSRNQVTHNGGAFSIFRRKDTWLCGVIGFTITASMLSFAGLWAVPWLMQVYGFSRVDAAATASLCFVGWAIMAPVFGWLTERLGLRKPILMGGLLLGLVTLGILTQIHPLPYWVIPVLIFLNGVGGCTMIMTFTCVREANAPHNAGAALGFVNMCVVGSGALFQPVLGILLDLQWAGDMLAGAPLYRPESFSTAFTALLAAYCIGIVACLVLKETGPKARTA